MKTLPLLSTTVVLLFSSLMLRAEAPIADDGSIRIRPGDSFVVQFDQAGDKLINPRVVEKVGDGIFIFFQAASTFSPRIIPKKPDSILSFMMGESPNHTILLVQKHLDGTLNYNCMVRQSGERNMDERSNLPIEEGFPMIAQYPEKIDLIVLRDFTIK